MKRKELETAMKAFDRVTDYVDDANMLLGGILDLAKEGKAIPQDMIKEIQDLFAEKLPYEMDGEIVTPEDARP